MSLYASVYILRTAYIAEVVDSLCHTHAFSRVILREFPVKWATMATPMVSENVHSYKIKQKIHVLQHSIMNDVGIGGILTHFQYYGCMFL